MENQSPHFDEESIENVNGKAFIENLKTTCLECFNESDSIFKLFTRGDPHLRKTDTARGLVLILDRFEALCHKFLRLSSREREKMFQFIYNTTIFMHQFCGFLKKVRSFILSLGRLSSVTKP